MREEEPWRAVEVYYALAAQLLDRSLLSGPGTGPGWNSRESAAIYTLGRLGLSEQTARDALAEARAEFPSLLDKLRALSGFVVVDPARAGRARSPARVLNPEVQRLLRLVEPDILGVYRLLDGWPDPEPPSDAELAWPAGLWRQDSTFESLCRGPMAETHLHLGGAVPTALLWVDLLGNRWFARERFSVSAGENTSAWIRALRRVDSALSALGYRWSAEDADRAGGSARADGRWGPPDGRDFAPPSFLPVWRRRVGSQLLRSPMELRPVPGGLEDVAEGLVGYRLLIWERRLLWDALERLRAAAAAGRRATTLEGELTAWIQVRNSFHHVLVHQEGGRGLGRFLSAFDRRSYHATPSFTSPVPRTRAIERRRMAMALDAVLLDAAQALPGRGSPAPTEVELRAHLELRGPWRAQMQGWYDGVVDVLERWADPPLKVGLIHHFIRKPVGAGAQADFEAEMLRRVRESWPGLGLFLLAVDGAGPEVDGGPRVFARAVQAARERRRPPPVSDPPLRVTWHAGEDFRDLLTGVRVIHEALWLLDMGADGRIGHGLALGWKASDFYVGARRGPPRLGEHALDLLWLCNLFRAAGGGFDQLGQRAERRLEDLLSPTGRLRLGELISPRDFDGVVFAPGTARPGERRPSPRVNTELELLQKLDLAPPQRSRLHWFDPQSSGHIDMVDAAQELVARALAQLGTTLELNPTSNTIIGGFGSPVDLPYRRFCDLFSEVGAPSVRFSINTDDPGLFMNWLRAEHVFVGETWARQQPGERLRIEQWLSRGVQEGLRSSFFERVHPEGAGLRRWLVSLRRPAPPGGWYLRAG